MIIQYPNNFPANHKNNITDICKEILGDYDDYKPDQDILQLIYNNVSDSEVKTLGDELSVQYEFEKKSDLIKIKSIKPNISDIQEK